MSDPTLISKIKWLGFGLPLSFYSMTHFKTGRSEVFQMNKLTACQRHQRLQSCKYQTESDIYRAGITLGTFSGS